jgi:hypothetical protein
MRKVGKKQIKLFIFDSKSEIFLSVNGNISFINIYFKQISRIKIVINSNDTILQFLKFLYSGFR